MCEELISFINTSGFGYKRKWFQYYKLNIIEDTELEKDLGIYGDDADEFIYDFSKRFNVDISNFDSSLYFSNEYDFISYFLLKKFGFINKKSFKVRDLINAIQKGYLI